MGKAAAFYRLRCSDRRLVTSFALDASDCHPNRTFHLSPNDAFDLCGSLFGLFCSIWSTRHRTDYQLRRTHARDGVAGYLQTAGTFGSAWFYWFCLLPVFGNDAVGARWLGVIVGLVMLAGAMATVVACRENTETIAKQPKIDLRATLSFTLRNRPFLLLQSVTVILVLGLGCEGVIGSYVHIYYTSQGSKTFASYVTGIGGTLTIFSTLAALSFGLWLSTHTSG